jgi:hypothetical protein
MKNIAIVPQLPSPPVVVVDLPPHLPRITQTELGEADGAEHRFRLARADYEQKRAALTLKLLQLCQPEPGCFEAELDEEGIVILTDWSSQGPAHVTRLVSV